MKNQKNKDTVLQPLTYRKKQVAQLLGVSIRTLERKADSPDLPPRRTIGTRVFYLIKDVNLFLNSREVLS